VGDAGFSDKFLIFFFLIIFREAFLGLEMDLVPLQSKFFPAKIFFCILEKGILAGKNLLF
jgi:hypothetical protein